MTTAERIAEGMLTPAEIRVTAAWRALCAARAAANRCPSALNVEAEEDAEKTLNMYLDRLPRQREATC